MESTATEEHLMRVRHFQEREYWKLRVEWGIGLLTYVVDNYYNKRYFISRWGCDKNLKFNLEELLIQQPDFEILNSIALVPPNVTETLANSPLEFVRRSYHLAFAIVQPDEHTYFINFENGVSIYIARRFSLHNSAYPEDLKEAVRSRLSGQHEPNNVEKENLTRLQCLKQTFSEEEQLVEVLLRYILIDGAQAMVV